MRKFLYALVLTFSISVSADAEDKALAYELPVCESLESMRDVWNAQIQGGDGLGMSTFFSKEDCGIYTGYFTLEEVIDGAMIKFTNFEAPAALTRISINNKTLYSLLISAE